MKTLSLLLVFSFASIMAMAQAGRVKITFVGFDCIRETWDDILNSDGKGDEVYFNFGVSLADRNGNTKPQPYEKRTDVYGDATGPFSNRISAGSCVDLFGGAKGGIKAGDKYRAPANYILGEFDMADGDILTMVPTAWEYDPIADNLNSFTSTVAGFYNSMNQKLAPIMIGVHALTGDLAGVIYHATNLGLSKTRPAGDMGELGKAGTRPIGMEKYGDFDPVVLGMNTNYLKTIATSNYGNGTGVIAVNYDENKLGNSRDHGNYTILVKVEFTPKPSAPAPAPFTGNTNTGGTTTINTTNQPVVYTSNIPIRNTAVISNLPVVVKLNGRWAGVQVSDDGLYPQNVAYELNEAGEIMIKVSTTGAMVSKGTYSIVNNVFSGTYKAFSDSRTYAFKGSYDPATQKLVFTLGYDPKINGQGKIEMNKQ